ncbi:MAG: putative lipid II flippase FtsW [Acinetobacter sp.]|jgi:cell division protein FtsW|nr:putative lipid II flippase FtsW [Acinetobacter sp.]HQW52878.1 putative lipid II flippase FtsW [Acinetobacter sp.]
MANVAPNAVQKIAQRLERVLPKLPAEMTARNILIFCVISLLCFGSVMVASASMPYAEYIHENPSYFLIRHGISIIVAAIVAFLTYRVSLSLWFKNAFPLWLITMVLLLAVLVIGSEVNGSHRWIKLGVFTLQPTEIAKIVMAIFTADYVVRRAKEVRTHWKGLFRLSGVMALTVGFIVAEPDLGATVVIVLMMVGVFFLAGAPATQFLIMLGAILAGITALILFEPFRFQRLISFTNPWADPLGVGYQLSNALMAFGRGEWLGTGLGHSVQKLSYLPEAHTDFMLAVLGEEFGFVGVTVVMILSFSMLACCIRIGHRALQHNYLRAGYLAYGISIIFLLQILVNAGMNMGLMPTKGLTLPFISYGGTSLMMCAAMISLILKIDASTQERNPVKEESTF